MSKRPTLADLRAQAEDAMREPEGPDIGPLSHVERNLLLFGVEPPEITREQLDAMQRDIDAKLGPREFRTVSRARW